MLEIHPSLFDDKRSSASCGEACVPHANPSPRRNRLLAAIPSEEYGRLLPGLEPVRLTVGEVIFGAGDPEEHLYFLTAGIVSRAYTTHDGLSASFSIAGHEGVIGLASFLGGEATVGQAVVVTPGHAYRLRARRVGEATAHGGALPHLLLRYTQAMMAQAGQAAVCIRHHHLEQQLCRWILSCLDRLPSNELAMTQGAIARMLGVRREGVSEAAGTLQRAGLIHCGHGHVTVLDRRGLEARACECYEAVRREYDRLLPIAPGRGARSPWVASPLRGEGAVGAVGDCALPNGSRARGRGSWSCLMTSRSGG